MSLTLASIAIGFQRNILRRCASRKLELRRNNIFDHRIFIQSSTTGTDNINYSWCDSAIESAYVSKNTYGATVYTVGIFEGADPVWPV